MGQRFVACDREQSFLMPPDVRGWLPEGHLAPTPGWPLIGKSPITVAENPHRAIHEMGALQRHLCELGFPVGEFGVR